MTKQIARKENPPRKAKVVKQPVLRNKRKTRALPIGKKKRLGNKQNKEVHSVVERTQKTVDSSSDSDTVADYDYDHDGVMLVPKQRSKASATHNPRTNFGYLFPAHDSFFYRYFVCNEFFWGKNYVLGQWPSQWWYENDTDYPPKGYIVEGLPLNPPPEEWQVACTKNPIPDLNLAYYNALDEHLAEVKKSMAENRMSKVVSNKKQRAEVDRTRSKKKTPWQREEGTGKLIRVDVPTIVEDDNDSSVSDKEVVGNDAKNGTENEESSTKEPIENISVPRQTPPVLS